MCLDVFSPVDIECVRSCSVGRGSEQKSEDRGFEAHVRLALYLKSKNFSYIYIYIYIYIYQNDKEITASYQVLRVSCEHMLQTCVTACAERTDTMRIMEKYPFQTGSVRCSGPTPH